MAKVKKNLLVLFRVTPDEKEAILRKAAAHKSLSEYLRSKLLDEAD